VTSPTLDAQTPLPVEQPGNGVARHLGRLADIAQRFGLLGVWAVTIAVFGALEPNTFLTTSNFQSIFGSNAVLLALTLGLIIPMTSGDFDLSVAANLTLSAMVLAILNVNYHWPVGAAIVVTLVMGAAIGLINGAIITFFGIDAIIVTLGVGSFLTGVSLWISGSNIVAGVSSDLVNAVVLTQLFGISLSFYYALALCVILWYVFEFTPVGRRLLIVGRDRNVARLSGLRVPRIRIGALMAAGLISSFAGVLSAGTSGAADPTSGTALLLPAFAAAFLGATTIVPGRFNPWGSFIAVYFLATGIAGFQILGVQSFVQNLFYGGALVVAVALSQLARKREELQAGFG
jgi:ribose transport system permease protein